MNVLFIAHYTYPHIGGVERHVDEVVKRLRKKGHTVSIFTEKYQKNLRNKEIDNNLKIVRFSYPHIKLVGLFFIWWEIFKNRKLITDSDIVHIHDVFIWYLPFRFLYPYKKVYTTFHGWEGVWPIPWQNILQKRVAKQLSSGTIAVGKYIEKYYRIKVDKIIYGGI